MTAALHPVAAFTAQPSDAFRAQRMIQSHVALIDAAMRTLRASKARLLPSIYEARGEKLMSLRATLERDLDSILAAPEGAKHFCGKWGSNGFQPNVLDACEAVDGAISRAADTSAYRTMIAARRAGLVVVR